MDRKIYAFSGLGADESVFTELEFPGYEVIFVRWIQPLQQETMVAYASRLLAQITSSQPILIGLSFGGMMAIEVAKQIDTTHVILLASAKTKSEIPFYFRWVGKLGLHRLLPAGLLKRPGFFPNWLFGVQSEAEKEILNEILRKTDPAFVRWAIHQIVCWKNEAIPDQLTHIHGDIDRLLPHRFVNCDHTISKGGHFMTLNRASEINELLMYTLRNPSFQL